MKTILFYVIAFITSALLSCSSVNPGTGSSTETGFISGKVYKPDGTTPAEGVTVYIRSSNSFVMVTAGEKPVLSDADSTVTDDMGFYSFDTSIAIGTYTVEALSDGNAAALSPVDVTNKTVSQTLEPLTLQPAGAISGSVELIGGGDPTNVYVLVAGVNRFARVASNGDFCLSTLAEGDYDLRILAMLTGYGIFDTSAIIVNSGDTTRFDTIILPYSGLPAPRFSVSADSLHKRILLRWNSNDTSVVKSYNIYRIEIDSTAPSKYLDAPFLDNQRILWNNSFWDDPTASFFRINESPVTDTSFIDSTVRNFRHYIYRVTAVDHDANEGNSRFSQITEVVNHYSLVTIIITHGTTPECTTSAIDVAPLGSSSMLVYDPGCNQVMKYTTDGELLARWEPTELEPIEPGSLFPKICIDKNENCYLSDIYHLLIQKYDAAGTFILAIDTSRSRMGDFCVDGSGNMYIHNWDTVTNELRILQYSPEGIPVKSWSTGMPVNFSGLTVKNGRVYCAGASMDIAYTEDFSWVDNIIKVFDTSGVLLQTVSIRLPGERQYINIAEIAVDGNGLIYLFNIASGTIRIYNDQFELVELVDSPFGPGSGLEACDVTDDGTIIVCGSGIIHILRQN